MSNSNRSRRWFIGRLGAVGAAGIGGSALLAGCRTEDTDLVPSPHRAEGVCSDVSGLTPGEIQMRRSLQYVDETPYPERRCDNCAFWIPEPQGEPCGGCTLIRGPIAAAGWCSSWVAG